MVATGFPLRPSSTMVALVLASHFRRFMADPPAWISHSLLSSGALCLTGEQYTPKSSARHFSEDHDYLVVYAKDAVTWVPSMLSRTIEQDKAYKNPDNDPRGPWKTSDL